MAGTLRGTRVDIYGIRQLAEYGTGRSGGSAYRVKCCLLRWFFSPRGAGRADIVVAYTGVVFLAKPIVNWLNEER